MAKLTYSARKKLPTSSFVEKKERKYPIPDASHGRNALARVSQFGSPAEKAKVRAAVHKKFPAITQKHVKGNEKSLNTPEYKEFKEHTDRMNKHMHTGCSEPDSDD